MVFHPYSDIAIHTMGTGLADGVIQANAGPQQFRTAPLWGAGQRLFFLHDGRTSDLTVAIAAHASPDSEANTRWCSVPTRRPNMRDHPIPPSQLQKLGEYHEPASPRPIHVGTIAVSTPSFNA